MDTDFIGHYWWLIFPLGYMVISLIRLLYRRSIESDRMRLIKSYTDQGKEPPEVLLKGLNTKDWDHC